VKTNTKKAMHNMWCMAFFIKSWDYVDVFSTNYIGLNFRLLSNEHVTSPDCMFLL